MRNPHAKSLREAALRQRVVANRKRARREQERLQEAIRYHQEIHYHPKDEHK